MALIIEDKIMTITYEVGSGLYVNLTNRCTNSCNFCVRSNGSDSPYGNLWLEREPEWQEALSEILSRDLSKYTELVFCGYGEPTMRLPDILKIIDGVREKNPIKIRINTNGHANMIFGRDVTPELEGRVDVISISLNTADAKSYDELCHPDFGESAYEGLLEFAGLAKRYVPEVVLSVVRTSIPDSDIEICRAHAERVGVKLRVREYID